MSTTTNKPAGADGGEFADLAEQIGRKLDWAGPDFPNYGELDVPLPAGHWRTILAVLASTARAGAGDWVAVPRDDDSRPLNDSALPSAMIWAGGDAYDDLTAPGTADRMLDLDSCALAVGIYRAMIEAAPAVPASSGAEVWRPIKTAPRDGSSVLCLSRYAKKENSGKVEIKHEWNVGYFEFTDGAWFSEEGSDITPSFWMPLPAPPGQSPAVPASPISTGGDEIDRATADEIKAGLEAYGASHPAPAEHGVEIREAEEGLSETPLAIVHRWANWIAATTDSGDIPDGTPEQRRLLFSDLRKVVDALSPHQGPETGGQGAGRAGEGRVPAAPCWSDKPEPVPVSALRATITSRKELGELFDICRGWHDALNPPGHPDGSFQISTENCDAEAVRLSLRATFRDVAAVLRELISKAPAPCDRSPAGAETHSGSVGDESAVTGAAGQAPSVPSPTDAKTGEV